MINRENIQAKLIADIDIIVQGILQNMSQKPIAIYLCGGIGRDEGSWYMDNNGIVCPYNDYDINISNKFCLNILSIYHFKNISFANNIFSVLSSRQY